MTKFSTDNQPTHDRSAAGRQSNSFKNTLDYLLKQPAVKLGTNDRVPVRERLCRAWIKAGLKGNVAAIEKIADRVDGKVVDKQAFTDTDGNDAELDPRAFVNFLIRKGEEAGLTPEAMLALLGKPKPGKE